MQAIKRRSAHGAVATFVAQALRFVLQFGAQVTLAHLLLPADFGLLAMIAPVLSFVQIFNELGLSQATIQKPEITQGELSALFWINVGISVTLATVMAAASPLVALFYGESRLTLICIAIAGFLVLSGMTTQHIALMNRRMKFKSLAAIDIGCAAVAFAGGVGGALAGLGYWSLVLMQAVNSVTILLMSWSLSGWRPSWPRRQGGVGAMLRFGGHLTGYNLINFAGNNCDSILIGKISGSVALGLYDRAFRLVASPIWQISLPVDRVASSLLSRLQSYPDRYRTAFLQMLQILLLITAPAVICTSVASATLVPLLLGRDWASASPIVAGLAIATGFAPLSISAYWLYVSQGRAGEQLRFVCFKTVISVVALLIGVQWGAVGVARSYAAFAILVHGLLLWGATRVGPVSRKDVVRACYPIVVAAVLSSVALLICQQRLVDAAVSAPLRLLIEGGLAYALFGLPLLCWPDGLRILQGVWRLRSLFGRAPAVS